MSKILQDVADVRYGKSQNGVSDLYGRFPIIGTGGLLGNARVFLFNGPAVVVGRKGTLNNPQYIPEDFWAVDTTYAVIPKENIHAKWLYFSLCNSRLELLNEATGVPSISRDRLFRIPVQDIDFPEQTRIAYVLDSIDKIISKTEVVIEKLKQVRAGMLYDLLNYGLDERGQLRDPIAHPEQFKDSLLGRIPREWDVRSISDFCESYAGGTPSRSIPSFFGGDIPWVKSGEVNLDEINTTEETLTPAGLNSSSAKWIQAETPLMAMYGATAGQVTWLTASATCNQAVLAIVPFSKQANSRFVFWCLQSVAPQIVKLATGSGQPNLSKGIIDRTNIVLPRSVHEQVLIAERIDRMVEFQKSEINNLVKLVALKSGLQDDLLTGRVRVTETVSFQESKL